VSLWLGRVAGWFAALYFFNEAECIDADKYIVGRKVTGFGSEDRAARDASHIAFFSELAEVFAIGGLPGKCGKFYLHENVCLSIKIDQLVEDGFCFREILLDQAQVNEAVAATGEAGDAIGVAGEAFPCCERVGARLFEAAIGDEAGERAVADGIFGDKDKGAAFGEFERDAEDGLDSDFSGSAAEFAGSG